MKDNENTQDGDGFGSSDCYAAFWCKVFRHRWALIDIRDGKVARFVINAWLGDRPLGADRVNTFGHYKCERCGRMKTINATTGAVRFWKSA